MERSNEEQKYLQDVLNKFNTNNDDPYLTETEKVLLRKVVLVEKTISELLEKHKEYGKEIKKIQEKKNNIDQQVIFLRGQSKGLLDSLLTLR